MEKKIKIKCSCSKYVPLKTLKKFQGDLKRITPENLEKLKKSIISNGFIAPFFIWEHEGENKIIDGHQRLLAIDSLKKEGYLIPDLPIVTIQAQNERQAKKILLLVTSQYGEFEISEIEKWLENIDRDAIEMIRLAESEIIINEEKVDINDLFNESDMPNKPEKQYTCPHCGKKIIQSELK